MTSGLYHTTSSAVLGGWAGGRVNAPSQSKKIIVGCPLRLRSGQAIKRSLGGIFRLNRDSPIVRTKIPTQGQKRALNGASGVLSCSSRWVSFAQGLSGRIPDVDQALSPTIPVFSVELKPTSDFASRLQRRHLPTRSAKSRRDFWLHTCSSVKTIEVTSVPNQESPSHSFRLREISPPSGNILRVTTVRLKFRKAVLTH